MEWEGIFTRPSTTSPLTLTKTTSFWTLYCFYHFRVLQFSGSCHKLQHRQKSLQFLIWWLRVLVAAKLQTMANHLALRIRVCKLTNLLLMTIG